jgi:hypothetical protein
MFSLKRLDHEQISDYGTKSELRTEGTSLTAYQHTLLRFDSAAIASTVGAHVFVKAELELTISNASGFIGDGAVAP